MEWIASLTDMITGPAKTAAGSVDDLGAATRAAIAQLKGIDAAQQKAATRAAVLAKAFNPAAYRKQIQAQEELKKAQDKVRASMGLGSKASEGLDAAASKSKMLALAIGGVAGASGALSLAQTAIGFRGMERLGMITARAQLNFRMLFKGIDSKPLEKAYIKFTDIFSVSSVTGRGIQGIFTRTFNSIFNTLDKAEPYITALSQGFLLAGLYAENAWLRARIKLFPLTTAISKTAGHIDGIKVVAYGAAIAVGLIAAKGTGLLSLSGWALRSAASLTTLGLRGALAGARLITGLVPALGASATGAAAVAAPFLAAAAAIGAVVHAADQLVKLTKEWDTDVLLRSIGIGESDADKFIKKLDAEAAARKAKGKPAPSRNGAPPASAPVAAVVPAPGQAKADGTRTGAELGAGIIAGMKSKEAAVTAGGAALARAADAGVRSAADIHSPSKLFRRRARQMGEGEELGLRDSKAGVEKAAGESLVPSTRGGLGQAQGGPSPGQRGGNALAGRTVIHVGSINVGGGRRDEVREDFETAASALFGEVQVIMGGAPAGAT